jgi:hypothetical protein
VADQFIFTKFAGAEPTEAGYRVGDQLTASRTELRLDASRLSAVVVVSNTCRFCIESVDFYRKLARLEADATNHRFQAIYLGMAGTEDAAAFVAAHPLVGGQVRPAPADILARVPGTPALMLVDATGRVRGSWVGKLQAREEAAVLDAIATGLKGN